MEVACRFPGVAGSGTRPVVLRVHLGPGNPVSIGQAILDVGVNGAVFTVVANVEGTIRDFRLRTGDAVAPGRVIMWVEAPRESLTDDSSSLGSARLIPQGETQPAPTPAASAEAPAETAWTPPAFVTPDTLAALNGR